MLRPAKDGQAHLRHTNAKTTLEHFGKSVPESVRVAVKSLDQLLKKKPSGSESPANLLEPPAGIEPATC